MIIVDIHLVQQLVCFSENVGDVIGAQEIEDLSGI